MSNRIQGTTSIGQGRWSLLTAWILGTAILLGCTPKAEVPASSEPAATAPPAPQAPIVVAADVQAPNCSDPQVLKIIADDMLAKSKSVTDAAYTLPKPVVERFFHDTSFFVDQITTEGYDASARRRACNGRLNFAKVEPGAMSRDTPMAYTIQMTEGTSGEFLVRTDDHLGLTPGWVSVVVKVFYDKVRTGEIKLEQAAAATPSSADWQRQCVTPKSTATATKLIVHGTGIFESPGAAKPLTVLKLNVALWAEEKQGGWLRLTGAADSAPYADGAPIGWVKESEIDYQAFRNCN